MSTAAFQFTARQSSLVPQALPRNPLAKHQLLTWRPIESNSVVFTWWSIRINCHQILDHPQASTASHCQPLIEHSLIRCSSGTNITKTCGSRRIIIQLGNQYSPARAWPLLKILGIHPTLDITLCFYLYQHFCSTWSSRDLFLCVPTLAHELERGAPALPPAFKAPFERGSQGHEHLDIGLHSYPWARLRIWPLETIPAVPSRYCTVLSPRGTTAWALKWTPDRFCTRHRSHAVQAPTSSRSSAKPAVIPRAEYESEVTIVWVKND